MAQFFNEGNLLMVDRIYFKKLSSAVFPALADKRNRWRKVSEEPDAGAGISEPAFSDII